MGEITRTVRCALEGFEDVEATYNLLATPKDVQALQTSVGDRDPGGVVVRVTGLPAQYEASGPFGAETPMALQLWLCFGGYNQAIGEFVRDPNSRTGSRRSTTATSKGG